MVNWHEENCHEQVINFRTILICMLFQSPLNTNRWMVKRLSAICQIFTVHIKIFWKLLYVKVAETLVCFLISWFLDFEKNCLVSLFFKKSFSILLNCWSLYNTNQTWSSNGQRCLITKILVFIFLNFACKTAEYVYNGYGLDRRYFIGHS